jgi:hypothetical protein
MQVAGHHSHLNGLEFLQVQKPWAWDEITGAIQAFDAKKMREKRGYSPTAINLALASSFQRRQWRASSGEKCMRSDANHLFKDRMGIGLQFGASGFGPYDIFAKHMALYVGNVIDLGIEILPTEGLRTQMSSGLAYYEGEMHNLIGNGRGVPAMPLILIGVAR